MKWTHTVMKTISTGYGVTSFLRNGTSFKNRILMYHAVGTTVPHDNYNLYNILPNLFRDQIQILAEYKSNYILPLQNELRPGISITFDDGYRDNLDLAAPILLHYKMPFTVFITPLFVKSGNPIYLSIAGIRELASISGVTIGAHGNTHRPLSKFKHDNEILNELTSSRKWLEDNIGSPVTTMSYPHGATNNKIRNLVAKAGYSLAASSNAGVNKKNYDPLMLARTCIMSHDNPKIFKSKLNGDWDWLKVTNK